MGFYIDKKLGWMLRATALRRLPLASCARRLCTPIAATSEDQPLGEQIKANVSEMQAALASKATKGYTLDAFATDIKSNVDVSKMSLTFETTTHLNRQRTRYCRTLPSCMLRPSKRLKISIGRSGHRRSRT